jgi:hypothetical protein
MRIALLHRNQTSTLECRSATGALIEGYNRTLADYQFLFMTVSAISTQIAHDQSDQMKVSMVDGDGRPLTRGWGQTRQTRRRHVPDAKKPHCLSVARLGLIGTN